MLSYNYASDSKAHKGGHEPQYKHHFTPYKERVPVSTLKRIPRDLDGNQQFLNQLLEMTTLSDLHIRLVQKEMPKRDSIYQELNRLLLRHRPPSELGQWAD